MDARGIATRWGPSASLAGAAVTFLVTGRADTTSAVVSALLLVLAVALSPVLFPPSLPDAEARGRAATLGVPVIYWRPGCVYCLRLRLALGRVGNRAVWVDVSRDAAASARVRGANGGDETVPTVFQDGTAAVNPAPARVRSRLSTT